MQANENNTNGATGGDGPCEQQAVPSQPVGTFQSEIQACESAVPYETPAASSHVMCQADACPGPKSFVQQSSQAGPCQHEDDVRDSIAHAQEAPGMYAGESGEYVGGQQTQMLPYHAMVVSDRHTCAAEVKQEMHIGLVGLEGDSIPDAVPFGDAGLTPSSEADYVLPKNETVP